MYKRQVLGAWKTIQVLLDVYAPADGVCIGVSDEGHHRPLYWSDDQREAPTLILGGTRRGKSTLQAYISAQDIRRGATVVVIDPHRDLALNLLRACAEAGREVVWFEPGDPDRIPGYNPLEVRDEWTPETRAKMLVDAIVRLWFPFAGEVPVRIVDTPVSYTHLTLPTKA